METGSEDDERGIRARLARSIAEGGISDVLVISGDSAAKALTDKRRELIDRIREGEIHSIRQLAQDLDRDVNAASRDLVKLFEVDIIEYDYERRQKIPALKHNVVVAPIAHKAVTQ